MQIVEPGKLRPARHPRYSDPRRVVLCFWSTGWNFCNFENPKTHLGSSSGLSEMLCWSFSVFRISEIHWAATPKLSGTCLVTLDYLDLQQCLSFSWSFSVFRIPKLDRLPRC